MNNRSGIILGAHHISRTDHSGAQWVAALIQQTQELLCGYGAHGYGAYAFYADRIPASHSGYPFFVFEVEASKIRHCTGLGGVEFFLIPEADHSQIYARIAVIGFINLPGFVLCPKDKYNFI